MPLKDQDALAASPVVASSSMNRSRRRADYARELALDPAERLASGAAWLDLCCGEGRALVEVAAHLHEHRVRSAIVGVDLAASHDRPVEAPGVTIVEANVELWAPDRAFDLITCVHGLHYVGDKLGLLARALGWLRPGGLLVSHLDPANLRLDDGRPAWRRVLPRLRAAGATWDARRGLLRCRPARLDLGLAYVGADDAAGPNRTGQPAVHSLYRAVAERRASRAR